MVSEADLVALARRLQARCIGLGLTVATAESCTGGLVGHVITEVPGSSAYFRGAVVAYGDEAKAGLLRVPGSMLQRHGAVSAQVALAMAAGARDVLRSDLAASITGIAGPDGGSAAKPVGLTYIAVAGPAGTDVRRAQWAGERTENKLESARTALELLLEVAAAMGQTSEAPPAGGGSGGGP